MRADDSDATVRFPCAWCGLGVTAPAGVAKVKGRCPHCGAVQDVPRPATPPPEPYALIEEPPAPAVAAPTPTPVPARVVRGSKGFWRSLLHESAGRESVLAAEISALLLLSVADLMTTYHLMRTHPKFYESNPVAQFFFARWNIAGMAVFKFSVIAFVVVVGEVVERRRPGLGRFVILTGCLASMVVVVHGLRLAFGEFAAE
ncbi:DUF5658 family protein [Paludisphaera mucosa]|uniref:DUF5658 family protein n=1 Tax=Paludisphaera mucosa TaxID=3030827 RepID=A0ABT6FGY7_9BACT|nr:DUF5658 family protein [Paludisphaera mucosa]MDG3006815.1 DUF5658 family protein [Paludisphaera mucosa]